MTQLVATVDTSTESGWKLYDPAGVAIGVVYYYRFGKSYGWYKPYSPASGMNIPTRNEAAITLAQAAGITDAVLPKGWE